ncbi:MAG: outer membrane protein assembly factor BamB [Gammaproteobacteria bacterium]|nr:outer membrane protein assembly factor BamB [Gammaproteobacteria bacterium]MBK80234.1 outer membrane protein assembly factor BamB [Gammaproteobacteria bacterium]
MQTPQTPAIRSFTLVLGALLVSGCSWFSWLPFVGDGDDEESAQEPAKLADFEAEVRLRREWGAGIGDGLGKKYLRIRPAVLADRLFVADGYGVVEARDRFSGKRLWRTRVNDSPWGMFSSINIFDRRDPSFLTGAVGVGHGYVLVGNSYGEVIALSASDGEEVWRTEIGSEVLAPPVAGEDLVFVRTIDGRLLALERSDGSIRWSFDNQVPVLTLRGTGTPVYADGVVFAGFANGMVAAVRAENGEPIWQHRVMLPEGRSELDRMVDVDSTPVLVGGVLYVAAYQGRMKALRASDGSLLWERDIPSHVDLAEGYSQIYVVDDDDVVHAIDRRTAEEVWSQRGLFRRDLSGPIAFSNYLVLGDADGWLHVLAQSDGRFLGRIKADGKGIRSRPLVSGDLFYVLGNSGKLRAYSVELR